MSNANESQSTWKSAFAAIVIPTAFVAAVCIYMFVLGNVKNFEGNDPEKGGPLNLLGTVHKGGFIVPVLIAVNLIILIFTVERFITIQKARGKGNIDKFIRNVRNLINNDQLDAAITECDRQKGSVASVIRAGLSKYKLVMKETDVDKESKVTAIKQELEEATALELPMLSKNLVILSTCASISTLIGLIGTVLGMIRSFSAMSKAGAPDTTALSTGISEALINTALGIIGSCIAIVFFNFFSTKIDSLTHGIDEAGFSVASTFAAKNAA
ncbi:MAG: MotA/TolQ/ExbB proton channel family protein [Bacteroidia bacterium]